MKTKVITKNTITGIGEVHESRFLIAQLFKRDFIVRYKQTSIGWFWAILNPMFNILLYMMVFGVLIRVQTPEYNAPYSFVLISGLVLWGLFSSVFLQSSDAIINNLHLLNKVYIPKVSLTIASLSVAIIDFLIVMIIFLVIIAFSNLSVTPLKLILSIVPIIATLTLALGLGMVCSILKIKYRDFRHLIPLVLQLLFFLSPVVYTPSIVPNDYVIFYHLNPLVSIIEMFRWCLIGGDLNIKYLVLSSITILIVFVFSLLFYLKNERDIGDFE